MGKLVVPVSVIIPTWNRLEDLKNTLTNLATCRPKPAEIIIHVDAGDNVSAPWLRASPHALTILTSEQQQGPGASRNKLMEASTQPYVASFDDDSFPIDRDYFQRLVDSFERHPGAGVLVASVCHRGEPVQSDRSASIEVADFIGCGCAYRKAAWKDTSGYLQRLVPYGIEEPDLSLQLLDAGWSIVWDGRLRIRHDTYLEHHLDARKTAGAIVNRALLAYVRYPGAYLIWGVAQYINRVLWSARNGRIDGIVSGLLRTPWVLWHYRGNRRPVSKSAVKRYRSLRDSSRTDLL